MLQHKRELKQLQKIKKMKIKMSHTVIYRMRTGTPSHIEYVKMLMLKCAAVWDTRTSMLGCCRFANDSLLA